MRKRKFLDAFYLKQLTQGASFQFQKDTLESAAKNETITQKLAVEIAEWKAAFNTFDEKLKLSRKSLITDEIKAADEERDRVYQQYRRTIKAYLDFIVPEKAEAAKVLWQNLKDYAINTKWNLTQQIGMTENLLQDLDSKYTEQVKALDLTLVTAALKAKNETVAQLIQQRNKEQAGRIVGETFAARQESEKLYKAFAEVLNAYSLIEGPEAYSDFIDQVNADIRRLKLTIRSGNAPLPDENEEKAEDK